MTLEPGDLERFVTEVSRQIGIMTAENTRVIREEKGDPLNLAGRLQTLHGLYSFLVGIGHEMGISFNAGTPRQ